MESPPFLPMIAGKIVNKKVHWLLPSKISLLSNSASSTLITALSKICYILCNNIILYSTSLIQEWGLEKYRNKILIAHEHFLDFDKFTVTTPFPDRPPLIGYIGRLSSEKGIQLFVKALPIILDNRKDFRVLIGGDGHLKDAILTSLQEEGLTDRITLPGWIPHDELPAYLNQLRLLVLPSYTEGIPNTMLEAMACGTPVLATPVGSIPDIITDEKTGFMMDDNSPECIAKNVIRALNSPDLEDIAKAGRRFVQEEFTFEKAIQGWKDIFEGHN